MPDRTCVRCGQSRPHKARGLCRTCWAIEYREQRYPEQTRKARERARELAAILEADGGPSYKTLQYWVKCGYLRPDVSPGDRSSWSWPPAEQQVAIRMGRLVNAGLRPEAAEKVARDPNGGPVVLGPGVVVSLFHPQAALGDALKVTA